MNKLTSISLHYHWVMGSSYYILYNIFILILYKSGEVVTFFEEDGRRGMTEAVSYVNEFLHCCFCVPSQVFASFDSPWKRLFICTPLESCLCIKQKVTCIYSYFEKGCRKRCMRQSWKALWVVLSSLFFKEIWKNWYERPWKCVCEC